MNSADRVKMIGLVEAFSNTENGAFLREFDWKSISFWTEAETCNVDSGTLGVYHAAEDTIGLMEACDPALIASTYVHELRHAYQRRKLGLVGYLLKKSVLRFVIEKEARQSENDFETWIKSK